MPSLRDVAGGGKGSENLSLLVFINRGVIRNDRLDSLAPFHDKLVITNLSCFKDKHRAVVRPCRVCKIIGKQGPCQLFPASPGCLDRSLIHIEDNSFVIKQYQRIQAD